MYKKDLEKREIQVNKWWQNKQRWGCEHRHFSEPSSPPLWDVLEIFYCQKITVFNTFVGVNWNEK